jgi:ribose transport system ATP-binding protein
MTNLPDPPAERDQPRLEITGLSKTFGPNRALRDVSMTLAAGEIHGLVGQNGSGKSTLVKLLSGYHPPDHGGEVRVDGRRLSLPVRPRELRRCGMSVVHQDLGLVDDFSVVENVRIGVFGVRRWTRAIRWDSERALARQALTVLGHEIDPDAIVGQLLPADRATVAIARALQDHHPGRGVIMFDESSRALPKDSLSHFHDLVHEVAGRGGSVLLVSHQLEEVLSVTDRVTVLRDGVVVGNGLPTSELTEHDLIKLMLGYELDATPSQRRAAAIDSSAPVAEVSDLTGRLVREVSFTVAPGEIVGLTGLLGSGFEELPYLVGGARRAASGRLTVSGRQIELSAASPRDFLDAGVALVPERRDSQGLAMAMTLLENVTLPRVRLRGARGRIGTDWQREDADWVVRELGVRPPNPMMPVGHLSGGNQQKVLLGKWLRGDPKLLVMHEPTRAVDVAARRDLLNVIFRTASSGCGVLVAGMDASELEVMCDRVLIMRDGTVAEEITEDLTLDRILHAVYGSPTLTNGEPTSYHAGA